MSLTIVHLFENPEHIPTVARWIHQEFWDGRPGHSVESMAARLREATTATNIPLSLLALVDGQPDNPAFYARLGAMVHEQARDNLQIMKLSALPTQLRTSRLLLRRWVAADREPFALMNSDPRVMEFFPATYTREHSDEIAARLEAHFDEHGYGLWAVEIPDVVPFAGFVGLSTPRFEAHFTPCIEIGWRLAVAYWGRGYATEAARAALAFGFESLGCNEIVSFTVPDNIRSRRVMEKIGMTHNPADDFDHPAVPAGHKLRRHVLYRIARPDWRTES